MRARSRARLKLREKAATPRSTGTACGRAEMCGAALVGSRAEQRQHFLGRLCSFPYYLYPYYFTCHPRESRFNFAFFQRAKFAAKSISSFEMAVLPIDKGLSPDKSDKQLRETVEAAVTSAGIQLEPTQPGLGPLPGQK